MEALQTLYAGMPLDLGIALALFAVFLGYAYSLGKHRAVTLLTALYLAGAVVMLAPAVGFLDSIIPIDARLLPILVFTFLVVAIYWILSRSHFFDPYVVPSGWELGVFALMQTVVAIVVVVSLVPASVSEVFSPNFARVFMDPVIRSTLIAAPLGVLTILRGR